MAQLDDFLQQLFGSGEITFNEPPAQDPEAQLSASVLLKKVFAMVQLEIAGAPLAFDPAVALAAAEFVRQACWFLVHRGESEDELTRRLRMPLPHSAAQHLSADLTLRYLPAVQARAQAVAPDDPLAAILKTVLRQWPLSGVLSSVTEAPLNPVEFDHPGLLLLYAERLAAHERPAWRPRGAALEYVRLVYRERGKENAAFLQVEGATSESAGSQS